MNLKPDLGLLHLSGGFDPTDSIFFYGVELRELAFVSDGHFSVMYEIPFGEQGQLYAMSLDFGKEIMGLLLRRLSPAGVAQFLAACDGQTYPFSAVLPEPIVMSMVECHLAEKVMTVDEEFVPFVIDRFE